MPQRASYAQSCRILQSQDLLEALLYCSFIEMLAGPVLFIGFLFLKEDPPEEAELYQTGANMRA